MRRHILLVFLIVAVNTSFAQTVDGRITKKKSKDLAFGQKERNFFFHKSPFQIGKQILSEDKEELVRSLRIKYSKFDVAPFKLSDCIFFNPIKSYFSPHLPKYEEIQKHPAFVDLDEEKHETILTVPTSLRMFLKEKDISYMDGNTIIFLAEDYEVPFDQFLTPFYFRKHEVTNKEYREFVHWVRDSLIRTMLYRGGFEQYGKKVNGRIQIDWDEELFIGKLESDKVEKIESMLLPAIETINRRRGYDTRTFIYQYTRKESNEKVEIAVYPDTLSWVNDYPNAYNEPLTNMYFWHSAYDDYPVVGITYYQALAFLDWKTAQHQKELDKKRGGLLVSYELPSEVQWDIASTAQLREQEVQLFSKEYEFITDDNWVTDLMLTHPISYSKETSTNRNKEKEDLLSGFLNENSTYENQYVVDGSAYTTKAIIIEGVKSRSAGLEPLLSNYKLIEESIDELGICFLGGNVSEWMNETYEENWAPMFELRNQLLMNSTKENEKILGQLEKYYDQFNDRNGRLVRGGNWYNERFSQRFGKNTAGQRAKRFLDPLKNRCTIGFRYVIYVEKKQ